MLFIYLSYAVVYFSSGISKLFTDMVHVSVYIVQFYVVSVYYKVCVDVIRVFHKVVMDVIRVYYRALMNVLHIIL